MIPLRDVIPTRAAPLVTIGLIAVNAATFLFALFRPGSSLLEVRLTWGLVPAQFSWVALLTSMFLHEGWVHLVVNLWMLWIFGDNVEARLGRWRFVLFFLFTGIAGGLVHVLVVPGSLTPVVGASGAVAGVLGANFVLFPNSRVLVLVPIPFAFDVVETPAAAFLALWLAVQLVVSVSQIIEPLGATFAGIGTGFLAGAAVGWMLRRRTVWR